MINRSIRGLAAAAIQRPDVDTRTMRQIFGLLVLLPLELGRLFSTLLSQLASAVVDTEAAAATAIIMAIICFFIDPP